MNLSHQELRIIYESLDETIKKLEDLKPLVADSLDDQIFMEEEIEDRKRLSEAFKKEYVIKSSAVKFPEDT